MIKSGVQRRTVLTRLLPQDLTNDELISQAILFFIAAFDTTTSLITLASYFLVRHFGFLLSVV